MGRKVYLGTNLINDTYVGLDKTNLPPSEPFFVDYVFAAGGGGGGAGGGAGGGGEIQTNYYTGSQLQLVAFAEFHIEVGDGGAHGDSSAIGTNPGSGLNGGNTFISSSTGLIIINALGGGGGGGNYDVFGGSFVTSEQNGKDGGTGGGGSLLSGTGGSATGSGYGLDGGDNSSQFAASTSCSTGSLTPAAIAIQNSAGGGGQIIPTDGFNVTAAARVPFTGSNGAIWFSCSGPTNTQWPQGGQGGDPFIIPWVKTATSEVGAGGGGGWTMTERVGSSLPLPVSGFAGEGGGTTGGNGGGRGRDNLPRNGQDGDANSGAGGGGGGLVNEGTNSDSWSVRQGGDGGSGIAVIKYELPQKYEGGELYYSGSEVLHVFTASGKLTPYI